MYHPFSICVICKNEEKHMDAFLDHVFRTMGDYPYEFLILDTGSEDGTLEILERYGFADEGRIDGSSESVSGTRGGVDLKKAGAKRLYHFDWINDFSAARNAIAGLASNDYILMLDCDEYLTGFDAEAISELIADCQETDPGVGVITRHNHYIQNGQDTIYTDQAERFYDRRKYHFEEIIHEQVRRKEGSLEERCAYERAFIGVLAEHVGYVGTLEELKQKADRNNELLLKELEQRPNDPYLYFQIGQSYNLLHDDERAAYYYEKGLACDVDPEEEYVQMMVIAYGYNLLHLGRQEEALGFESIREAFATTADFVLLMGLIYLRNEQYIAAMKEFLTALSIEKCRVEGANSFIPRYNMGCINELMGNRDAAIALYKACGDFVPAVERLKELGC